MSLLATFLRAAAAALTPLANFAGSLAFGSGLVASGSSATKTVTLSNTGTGTLNIASIAVLPSAGAYALDSTTCGSTLGAGQTCSVVIRFSPTRAKTMYSGTVTVTDDSNGKAGSKQSLVCSGISA